MHVCPNCGHCPTCGRGPWPRRVYPWQVQPIVPVVPVPYYVGDPIGTARNVMATG